MSEQEQLTEYISSLLLEAKEIERDKNMQYKEKFQRLQEIMEKLRQVYSL